MTLDGVGHAWPGRPPLFAGVSRTFEPGRVCALVGPSGSGKSTLLAVLAGMVDPTEGIVHRAAPDRVLWVFQNPHGVARRSARDHVALPFVARGADRRSADRAAEDLLERFGLVARASARFSELSGGEAQRLMLARGIAAEPDLMLVDEPTAQLDRATADEVNRSIGELAGTGTAVVVATHDADTRAACDDVLDLGDHRGGSHPPSGVARRDSTRCDDTRREDGEQRERLRAAPGQGEGEDEGERERAGHLHGVERAARR